VAQFSGTPGEPANFDLMYRLLEAQAYRLAHWLVASDEINYRRFFDINELAGIRMDDRAVFNATHRLIERLIASGEVNSLRIHHPDGLSDPHDYYCELQRLTRSAAGDTGGDTTPYLLVEKILASHEHLPADWPVAGTTGYEVAQLLNGLFVYPGAVSHLSRLYARFIGQKTDFDQALYAHKKLIIHSALASELSVLANLASAIACATLSPRSWPASPFIGPISTASAAASRTTATCDGPSNGRSSAAPLLPSRCSISYRAYSHRPVPVNTASASGASGLSSPCASSRIPPR
jgi:(1->4)-alpha-D-glucan 1-alpha-D-glucosylmutase